MRAARTKIGQTLGFFFFFLFISGSIAVGFITCYVPSTVFITPSRTPKLRIEQLPGQNSSAHTSPVLSGSLMRRICTSRR